jgi:hypothetical protein
MGFEGVDGEFDNFCRYENGTVDLSLICGNVNSINMIDMDLRYLDMTPDIRYHH